MFPFPLLRSNTKYIYGPSASVSTPCSALRTYAVAASVGGSALSFTDDWCGALALPDPLGGVAAAGAGLFLFLGADDDPGTALWHELRVWAAPQWSGATGAPTARPTPTPAPTPGLGPPVLTDTFEAFAPGIWAAPCAGCSYAGGSLYVSGSDMLLRSVDAFSALRRKSTGSTWRPG